jgi:hypothetical protein
MEAQRQQQLVSKLAQHLPGWKQKAGSQHLTASDLDALDALLDNHCRVRAQEGSQADWVLPPSDGLCVWAVCSFTLACPSAHTRVMAADEPGPSVADGLQLPGCLWSAECMHPPQPQDFASGVT